ncbi:MAG: helix-hairpin-helix domain-containing protein [Thermoplasmata archaeon]
MNAFEELQRIKGIGEVRAKKLVESGIESLGELSEMEKKELEGLGLNARVIGNIFEYFEDFDTTEVKKNENVEDEYESHILEWRAEGYNVAPVEKELAKSKNPKKVIEKYIEGVELSRELRKTLMNINVAEVVKEAKGLLDMTYDLEKINEWEEGFKELMNKIDVRNIKYELEDMKTPQLEDRINRLIKHLNETMDIAAVQNEVEDIKREYQENFFVSELIKEANDKTQRETVKVKQDVKKMPSKTMAIDDIYLFHGPKNMQLIKWYKHKYTPDRGTTGSRNIVNDIRNFVRSENKLRPRLVMKVESSDGTDIFLTRGKTLLLAATVSGELSEYGKKVLVNSINLIEKVDGETLKNWSRTDGEPEYLQKVMKALLLLSLRNRKGGGKK